MMFSLTSSLIRPVSLPNTGAAIRPDSTPTPTIPTRAAAFKHSNKHKEEVRGGEKMPGNRLQENAAKMLTARQKSETRPAAHGQMFLQETRSRLRGACMSGPQSPEDSFGAVG